MIKGVFVLRISLSDRSLSNLCNATICIFRLSAHISRSMQSYDLKILTSVLLAYNKPVLRKRKTEALETKVLKGKQLQNPAIIWSSKMVTYFNLKFSKIVILPFENL